MLLFLLVFLFLSGCSRTPETPDVPPSDPQALATSISDSYGIEVHIGQDAAEAQPWDYSFLSEPDEDIQLAVLRELNDQLAWYPQGMLKVLSEDCGGLHICIVRKIIGKEDTGSLPEAKGLQFHNAQGCFLALALDREYTLYHELCHVIEDYLAPRVRVWDNWEDLNPLSFDYDLDFQKNAERDDSLYLNPENRSFIDTYSMSFPREDRARIMEYAMTEGNAHYFSSPVMQAKLKLLSEGIRQGFGLQECTQVFRWEQYLQEEKIR